MSRGFAGIRTDRLLLRQWRDGDRAPFAAMNADPRVREFFPGLLTRAESDASIEHFAKHFAQHGFCFFAAERLATQEFIGFVGLQQRSFAVEGLGQPAVEIGWRLAAKFWGCGLATEGAQAVLRDALRKLPQVVAITVPANVRSRRVMEKLGMRHRPELDFEHPGILEGHLLRGHVVYSADGIS